MHPCRTEWHEMAAALNHVGPAWLRHGLFGAIVDIMGKHKSSWLGETKVTYPSAPIGGKIDCPSAP